MNKSKILKTSISVLVILFVWYLVTEMGIVNSYVLPSPLKVIDSFCKMVKSGEIFEDIYISYIRVFKGFFLATFLLAMVRIIFPKCNDYYETIIQFLKNVPPLSLISLLILWCGIGETTKISIIVLTAFFPIYLNTVKGFVSCDKKLLEVGQVYGYSKVNTFFKIMLPYAMSDILVGMRIGLGYSWRAIIGAEMIAASTGLGHMILFALTDRLFAFVINKTLKGSEKNGWD